MPPRNRSEIPTTEHLEWMIEGRAKNQSTTLKLYEPFSVLASYSQGGTGKDIVLIWGRDQR
jgi:hypothetical protein